MATIQQYNEFVIFAPQYYVMSWEEYCKLKSWKPEIEYENTSN